MLALIDMCQLLTLGSLLQWKCDFARVVQWLDCLDISVVIDLTVWSVNC